MQMQNYRKLVVWSAHPLFYIVKFVEIKQK